MAYKTVNPFTGEAIKSFNEIRKEAVDEKLQKAAASFETWRKTSFILCNPPLSGKYQKIWMLTTKRCSDRRHLFTVLAHKTK